MDEKIEALADKLAAGEPVGKAAAAAPESKTSWEGLVRKSVAEEWEGQQEISSASSDDLTPWSPKIDTSAAVHVAHPSGPLPMSRIQFEVQASKTLQPEPLVPDQSDSSNWGGPSAGSFTSSPPSAVASPMPSPPCQVGLTSYHCSLFSGLFFFVTKCKVSSNLVLVPESNPPRILKGSIYKCSSPVTGQHAE